MNRDYAYPLRVTTDRWPDHPVFVNRDTRWTYREFDAATDRLAGSFARRGLIGQNVVLLLQNEPMMVMTYLALARVGAVAVPVNPRLMLNEIAFVVDDSEAATIITDVSFADGAAELLGSCASARRLITVNAPAGHYDGERLEDLMAEEGAPADVDVDQASLALIVYTSGTSGTPKGVARSHEANLWATVNSMIGQPRLHEDTEVLVLPMFSIAFIFQVLPMILAGGTVVLDGAFDPARTWELLEQHRATRVFLAPTMLAVEGHEARDVSSLRILNTAYEFPQRVREATKARFGDIVAYMYGLTEAQLCVSTPEQFAADPTDAGPPMGMMRVRVVDDQGNPLGPGEVGEITMEGPSLMSEYYRRPEATADALRGGWLHTGDLGYGDEQGRIHISGRKKEMIKTGGFSVDPVEVENALLSFETVREAAVVGVPDEHWGEQVVAFVALSAGAAQAEGELLTHVKSQIASFKCPKRVWFVAELPKNPMGKVQRGELRKTAAAGVQQVQG